MKIFVVVGTQAGFDRMVKTIDEWNGNNREVQIEAQIGDTQFVPENMKSHSFIPPAEFNVLFNQADLIVSHAGIGSILSALQNEKPILVMPRLAKYKEHRNDHQLHTASSFEKLLKLKVAYDEKELLMHLNDLKNIKPLPKIPEHASDVLISRLLEIV